MSINALEVFQQIQQNRAQIDMAQYTREFVESPYWDQRSRFAKPEYPPYHSPEWWDLMWKKHEEWRLATYPPEAGTGFEVTPATGIDTTEPIRYGEIKAGKVLR